MNQEAILSDIRKIIRSLNLESKRIQKEFGVSIPQLLCLQHLDKQEDFQSTQKALCSHLNLSSSTMTGIVDRLEKRGLVARMPKKGDKRTTYISLTGRGKSLLSSTPDLLQDRLMSRLGQASESEVNQIRQSLSLLIRFFGISEMEASPFLIVEDAAEPAD